MADEHWIERLAEADRKSDRPDRAPARLKARLLSALVNRLAETGPLLGLGATKDCGGRLCVFEEAVAMLGSKRLDALNPCNVCHARVLGERLEHAPIYWPHCPYAEFHKRQK